MVSPGRLQQANALRGVASSTAQIAGPAAAGLIVAAGGAGWAIAIDGATYAISAVCLARLHLPAQAPPPRESFAAQLRTGWTEFRSRTWLWGDRRPVRPVQPARPMRRSWSSVR